MRAPPALQCPAQFLKTHVFLVLHRHAISAFALVDSNVECRRIYQHFDALVALIECDGHAVISAREYVCVEATSKAIGQYLLRTTQNCCRDWPALSKPPAHR